MQFRVPQFIDVEDKLFGPFTFKQFLYMLGSVALSFIIWSFIPIKMLALILVAPILGLGVALVFVPINGKPFIFILEAAFNFYVKDKLYIWRKVPRTGTIQTKNTKEKESSVLESSFTPRLSNSKLKELGWGLDVYDTNSNN